MDNSEKYLDFRQSDVVLLITGCISPIKEQKWLVLSQTSERLRQYVLSIEYYILKSPFHRIVFCDNSAYLYDGIEKLKELAYTHDKEFEWLSFQGNTQKVLECGKGYGEGEIIHYALSNSELLKKAKSFAKVTGRLTIENIDSVVNNSRAAQNYFLRDRFRGHGIDTRFYLCDLKFYKQNLESAYHQTMISGDRVIAIEDVFFEILSRIGAYRTPMDYPAFRGKSGGNGRDYSSESLWVLRIIGVLCRFNVFNQTYPIVLAIQKLKILIMKNKG